MSEQIETTATAPEAQAKPTAPVAAAKPAVKATAAPKTAPKAKTAVAAPAAPKAPAVKKPVAPKSVKATPPKKAEPKKSEAKPVKVKMVRDSFTFPETDHSQLAALKKRVVALGQDVKKGELVRAGIALLAALDNKALLAAVANVDRLKTGRPKK